MAASDGNGDDNIYLIIGSNEETIWLILMGKWGLLANKGLEQTISVKK